MSATTPRPDESLPYSPLILIFSTRERIRNILSLGLMQCHFRITQSSNSDIASLKASQFIPDLIVADITQNNTKDILMVNRLQHSERTKNTPLLAVVPVEIKGNIEKIIGAKSDPENPAENRRLYFIEYPFSFSALIQKIYGILQDHGKQQPQKPKMENFAASYGLAERIGEKLFDLNIPVTEKFQNIAGLLQKQWVFPYTVIKAMDIIGSETSCCEELSTCIKSDVSASAAILKLANTVHYAKRTHRITDIKEAVVRLGFQQTRNLLSCFALIDMSPESYPKSGFTRLEFWMHSLSVALIAQKLCEDVNYRRPELAFVAGLLHDLGKIPLDNNFKEVFPRLLEETTTRIDLFYATEKRMMGFSHADLGHYLTALWNFPASISSSIQNHHDPEKILASTPVVDRILQEAVFIANQLSKALYLGHSCDEVLQEIPRAMLRDFNIPKGPAEPFIPAIVQNLNHMATYLGIPLKQFTLSQPAPEQGETAILFVHGNHSECHPLVIALRQNGYCVHTIQQASASPDSRFRAIMFMPEPETPLDIVLYDDEQKKPAESAQLKIYIMDIEPEKASVKGFTDSNMIFLHQDHLDVRFVLHILDKHFGKVTAPQQTAVE